MLDWNYTKDREKIYKIV